MESSLNKPHFQLMDSVILPKLPLQVKQKWVRLNKASKYMPYVKLQKANELQTRHIIRVILKAMQNTY